MKKKVVHIAKVTGVHGMEKHLLCLLPELNKSYEIIFIVLSEPGNSADEYCALLRKSGITVNNIRICFDMDLLCLSKIYFFLKKLQPSIVHTHLIHGDLFGIVAAGLAGVDKIISTKHNDDSFRQKLLFRALNNLLNKKTDRIIAISDWIRHFACKVEGVPPEKIRTIYYGLPEMNNSVFGNEFREEMGFGSREVVLGIIARLVKQKGHSYLIKAFANVYEKNRNIRLVIAGDGELRSSLKEIVQRKKLDSVVHFVGYRKDVREILAAVDIFVHPSLWEGFGLSILEAMAMGKPIIATDISAIPELVKDRVTGFLVPPKDISSLAGSIESLSSDEGLRQKLGQKAKERCLSMFSVESMIKKTLKLYDEF